MKNTMPKIADYAKYIKEICELLNISEEVARKRYGYYTYKQWQKLILSSRVEALKVGGSMDLKLSNVSRKEIYRIDQRRFEISCTV